MQVCPQVPDLHMGVVESPLCSAEGKLGGVPITCDGCKSTLIFPRFSRDPSVPIRPEESPTFKVEY